MTIGAAGLTVAGLIVNDIARDRVQPCDGLTQDACHGERSAIDRADGVIRIEIPIRENLAGEAAEA